MPNGWCGMSMGRISHNGITYNRLTILGDAPDHVSPSGRKSRRVFCRCECGTEKVIGLYSITSGDVVSCGCWRRERITIENTTHGMADTPAWYSWQFMKHNKPDEICEKWLTFEGFFEDMGQRDEGQSLLRIDKSKPFSKENCRWATDLEQGRHLSLNKIITLGGETKCLSAWADGLGVSPEAITKRIQNGWDIKKALTTKNLSGVGNEC